MEAEVRELLTEELKDAYSAEKQALRPQYTLTMAKIGERHPTLRMLSHDGRSRARRMLSRPSGRRRSRTASAPHLGQRSVFGKRCKQTPHANTKPVADAPEGGPTLLDSPIAPPLLEEEYTPRQGEA